MTVREWLELGLRMNWSIYAEYEQFEPQDEYPENAVAYELTAADKERQDAWYALRGGQTQWYLNRPLDLSTDAPDGTYDVEHHYVIRNPNVEPVFAKDHDPNEFPPTQMPINLEELYPKQTVTKHGVVVKDGQFVPTPTAQTIYACVLHGYLHNDPNKAMGI